MDDGFRSQAASLLFAILVRDFGYHTRPEYGHTPMRHQFAWVEAVEGMSAEQVAAALARTLESKEKEDEDSILTLIGVLDRLRWEREAQREVVRDEQRRNASKQREDNDHAETN